jgi:hypothetical protein
MSGFRVRLYDAAGTRQAEMTLPFAPYPGLLLQAAWLRGDFVMIALVYWLSDEGLFECYEEPAP